MGTDIYLSWKGIEEGEKKSQFTGWSIDAGNVGYLRASIGMAEENTLLRVVFPKEFWESGNELEYDFKGNFDKMIFYVKQYLFSRMTGVELKIDSKSERYSAFGAKVASMFSELGFDAKMFGPNATDSNGFGWDLTWANSLVEFFRLGMQKQEEEKNPTVYISW